MPLVRHCPISVLLAIAGILLAATPTQSAERVCDLIPLTLGSVEKERRFGVGLGYVPRDLYDKAGAPVKAARCRLPGKVDLYVFDVDGDGKFAPQTNWPYSPRQDAMAMSYFKAASLFIVPFVGELVLSDGMYALSIDGDKARLEPVDIGARVRAVMAKQLERESDLDPKCARAMLKIPTRRAFCLDLVRGVVHVNELRMAAGLAPVSIDAALSAGALAHAYYLNRNGWGADAHRQDATKKAYTSIGNAAAKNSPLWPSSSSLAWAADHWNRTAFHGVYVYDNSKAVGGATFGWSALCVANRGFGVTARPCTSESDEWARSWAGLTIGDSVYQTFVFPPNGSTGNLGSYGGEANAAGKQVGFTNTGTPVYFRLKDAPFDLENVESMGLSCRGRPVATSFYHPGSPAPGIGEHNGGLMLLVPKKRLRSGDYRVRLVVRSGTAKSRELCWTFGVR
jgi:Cysteine-rich secretory protein family